MCNHLKTKKINKEKTVAGLVYSYKTKECLECGATLWGQENEYSFLEWLAEQKKEHLDKFTIQKVVLPNNIINFAADFARSKLVSESDVYQACLQIYFSGIFDNKIFDKYPVVKIGAAKKFRVNPLVYISVEADSKIYDRHMNEVASFIIQKILGAAIEGSEEVVKTLRAVA